MASDSALHISPPPSRHLTAYQITVLIVAAAAPLSAMVGTVPLAIALGTGAGVPAAFVFAGLTLLCFSVGFAVTARRTGGEGGFYASAADGLGRPAAVATGYVAVVAYNAATIGLVGALGYFTQLVLADHGIALPWEWCAAVGLLIVALLGYREISLSARLLTLMMIGEIGVLLALDVAVIVKHGLSSFPAASFDPQRATGPGLGVGVMFAFVSFIGFESASLYGKEARNPRRDVPRATYAAVLVIAGFYAVTSWLSVGAVGPSRVRATAAAQSGDFFFVLGHAYLGSAGAACMQVLLCTSLLAASLALHSAANRYSHVLAGDGLLPRSLGTLHAKYASPHRASAAQVVLTALVIAGFALAGLDPYTSLTTIMLGIGTLGIVVLQAIAALSVLGLRRKGGPFNWWRDVVAPVLGLIGLVVSVALVVENFDMLTGTSNAVVAALPWLLVAAAGTGLVVAWRLRRTRPEQYRQLGLLMGSSDPASAGVGGTVAAHPLLLSGRVPHVSGKDRTVEESEDPMEGSRA